MNNDDTVTYSDPDVEALGGTIESDQLPAVPAVALAIMAACKDEDVDFHELTSLVSADPALATRFLTLANSGIFGGQRRISSLRAALVRLGLRLIHATSLAFALAAEDMQYAPAFDAGYFWRFALTTSHAAHRLAEQLPGIDADNAYAAGLLQDIGVLALQSAVPDKYTVVLEACLADSTVDQATVEREVLGTTHMLVGGYLLKTWGLPPEIYRPVTFHKSSLDNMPEGLPHEAKRFYRVLCLGDAIGKLFNGPDRNIHHDSALRTGEEEFGLARSRMQQILEDVERGVALTASAFDIDRHRLSTYQEIRTAGLRQIGRLAAQMEADFREYRARAEDAREELDAMEAHREQLQEQLSRDELTSLLKRSAFQTRCETELARGARTGEPITVVFLDIDHFKSVNDRFGHAAGDQTLRAFGEYVLKHIRRHDSAARYGGDEFALLLPGTDLEDCLQVVERLRRGVARESGKWADGVPGFTVSVGLAHLKADHGNLTVEDLLEEADKCLYVAKAEGRNCIRSISLPTDSQRQAASNQEPVAGNEQTAPHQSGPPQLSH